MDPAEIQEGGSLFWLLLENQWAEGGFSIVICQREETALSKATVPISALPKAELGTLCRGYLNTVGHAAVSWRLPTRALLATTICTHL